MITFAKKRTLESVKKGVQSTLISVTSTNEQGTASNQIFEEIVNNKNKKTSTRDVVPKKFFDKESGYFLLTEDNPLLKALEKKISLNSIADTNQGITTGSNDTFVWDESLFETVNLNSYEKLLFKPLIRGSELVEPTASSLSSQKSFIMYMSTKTTNIDRTPNLKSFIENSKDYVRIHERAIEERNEGDQYYLWRERNSQIFKRTSIYYQKRTQNPMFTLNDKGFYIKDDAYAITLKNPNEDDALILLTVLNSTFTHFWLVAKGRKKGKSLELYPEVIRTLPVPNLKLISKEDLQQVKLAVKQLDRRDFKLFANKKVAEWFSLPGVVDEMEEYINNNQ
ncbi:TaqI-like C-terminal specificity domain-containing protein [Secundilactobacillus similis]|nr:TaqI-like C-terminal specificity domain-containing protein [Secundilactobacillus similis]